MDDFYVPALFNQYARFTDFTQQILTGGFGDQQVLSEEWHGYWVKQRLSTFLRGKKSEDEKEV